MDKLFSLFLSPFYIHLYRFKKAEESRYAQEGRNMMAKKANITIVTMLCNITRMNITQKNKKQKSLIKHNFFTITSHTTQTWHNY